MPPTFPRSIRCAVLWNDPTRFCLASTGLSPSTAVASQRTSTSAINGRKDRPNTTFPRGGSVCPLPVSLAVTKGIPFGFFSSPYYDVSVRGVPIPSPYGLGTYAIIGRILEVLFGDLRIEACLRLPAAFPSLPGPSSAPEPSRPPSGGCVSDLT